MNLSSGICSYPGSIANGYFSGSEFIEGREVRFYCRGGFDLIGSQTIRCLPTGRWTSGQRPECKRKGKIFFLDIYSPRKARSK